jgi:hypothetical protein
MSYRKDRSPMRRAWDRLKRLLQPSSSDPGAEPPDDPYSYVGAPKKPRPPLRSSSVAADPEN